jgi:hypothetical protein
MTIAVERRGKQRAKRGRQRLRWAVEFPLADPTHPLFSSLLLSVFLCVQGLPSPTHALSSLAPRSAFLSLRMKAETLLAELNRLRQDVPKDPSDIEWLTLHHVFCFVSYKMGDFQKYVTEEAAKGAFKEFEETK